MKRILALTLPVALMACLQAPSPEVKPVSPDQTFKPTLLGSVTLQIDSNLGVQGSKFIPNPRLSSQALSPVTESTLVFTQQTLQNIDRPSSGDRYLIAPFKVTNNNAGNLANLTLVAYHKNGNVGGSGFRNIQTFGGTLNPNVNTLLPIHTMTTAGACSSVPCVDNAKADLQIFTRGEIGTLTTASEGSLINNGVSGEGILHYGFIARKGSTGTYRTIAGTTCNPGANVGCNEGTINLGLRVPQSNDPNSTAYRYSMTFLVFTDNAPRVTESIEEQGTTNAATRATALGGSPQVAAMCGTSLGSGAATYITGVRTVGVGTNTETALMGGKFLITDNTPPNYTVNGNIGKSFNAAGGLLTPKFSALGGATLTTALVGTPANSSNITINTDGSLSINPAANLRTTDSFNYSIGDGTCTWTRPAGVTIANAVTWFVKNNVVTTGNGRFSSPFKTLLEAQTASVASDTIYVYNGDNSTTGQNAGITLKAGQKLIGQGAALTVGGDTIEVAGTKPTIGNSGGDAITLNSGNTVQGLLVGNTPAANYSLTGGSVGTLTIGDVNINNTTGAALNLVNGTLTATFGSISSNASSSNAVSLSNAAGTLTASTISVTNMIGTTADGITIVSSAGTFNLGTVSLSNIAKNGFFVNGGSPTINATSLTISNTAQREGIYTQITTGGTITLNTIDISGTATDGISYANGAITVNILAGSIQNSGGNNIYMAGGTGNFSYAGSITDTNSPLVYIENTTGGTKTFSGAMNGNGASIGLLNNTGATINFSGDLTLSTGGQAAFSAGGGGTVNVTGTNNTLTTTTGTALNVANTTIGSSNLNFRSISSNGAASGIILNNTGSSGGLIVTGTGTAASGGTIQNATADGISLTSTQSPSFARMNIASTVGYGIKGTGVTNFSFTDGSISNSGTGLGVDSANLGFNTSTLGTENNLSGAVTITGNTLSNAYYHGVDISNFNGTISNATISSNTITSATAAANSKGSGIRLRALGSASTVAKVTRAAIAGNTISNFPSGSGILAQAGNLNAAGSPTVFGTSGSATDIISIIGNLIAGQSAANRLGGTAITASVSQINSASRATANFDISNNGTVGTPIAQIAGNGIVVSVDEYSDATATVSNNVLAINNTLGSPSIFLVASNSSGVATANPSLNVTANSNNISQSDGDGILAAVRASNGTMRAKIQSNTSASPLSGNRYGIRVDSGNSTGNATVCLNISGNTSNGSGVNLGVSGIGLRRQTTNTNTFGINGMSATATPGIESFVNGLNPAGTGTLLISGTTGFSNCTLP